MSWFNRKPKLKEPKQQLPKHSSPTSEKLLKDTKKRVTAKIDENMFIDTNPVHKHIQ
jgi:hypothetical protein